MTWQNRAQGPTSINDKANWDNMPGSCNDIKLINPHAAAGQYKMMQKKRMTETLAHGYLYESTQWGLSNEYQTLVFTGFKRFSKSLLSGALDEGSLSNGRVNPPLTRMGITDEKTNAPKHTGRLERTRTSHTYPVRIDSTGRKKVYFPTLK